MKKINLHFPTFIYYSALAQGRAGGRLNRELLSEVDAIRDYDTAGQKWSAKNYPGGYTSYGTMAQLHKFSSTFADLERHITRHVKAYAKHLEYDLTGRELEMTDCWLNIMPPGAVHSLHLHPLSTISGTYYVTAPRNCSSIKFEDPRLSKFMAAPPKIANASPDHQRHIKYEPKPGHLILFESWLRHEVASNQSKQPRISISFNYNWF
jgi:uncharacterized protein (TIGR02466 family)